ncbi:flagellar hook-basal body complex protein [Hathewaya histolytica]|uniref:flagellar hook-basal body complex protein n=1 Tax=Hathewaya histolytica TaxID=1498 RepID=UPI003B66F973
MNRLMWTSKGAMVAQQEKLDSISNNLANIETNGYKKVNVSFSDLLGESLDRRGYPKIDRENVNLQHNTGVKTSRWIRDNSQGSLLQTGRSGDLAIDGEGYFQVTLKDGSKGYTRDGALNIDRNGDLVDKNGNYLDIMNNGRIVRLSDLNLNHNSQDLYVGEHGEVNIRRGDEFTYIGNLQVNKFIGDEALISKGNNVYVRNTGSTMIGANNFSIHQGYLEQSNVEIGDEMAELILAQRAFQLSSNALKTNDEMWGMVNNLRGR